MFNIPLDEADRQNEPEEIRSLSKKQLHKFIGIRKVLPDLDARCCTRAYLVRVHLDEVYSVSREELLTFEGILQPGESLKSPFFNVGQLTTRLDQLLTHKGKLNFGFPAGTLADDPWISRVLRLEDPANLLPGCKRAVRNQQVPPIMPGRV